VIAAVLTAVAVHLPATRETNADLAESFPDWPIAKIAAKTGILARHLSAPHETASDLAVLAGRALFAQGRICPADIDFIVLCTQSPDHLFPTTACLVQDRLGIPTTAGALDVNLGCSGYVYCLGLAQGLIATGQARRLLLLTAETYSKFLDPHDRATRTLFGDAATATLIEADAGHGGALGCLVHGTDGAGGGNLMARQGGLRCPGRPVMDMDGPEIFAFTLKAVPSCLDRLWSRSALTPAAIDQFIFHQANVFMLEHLRRKLGLPSERFAVHCADTGNTGSSTIPIVLAHLLDQDCIRSGQTLCLVGFGVGYSWAAGLLHWR
jgi:3-oxoacyl-[acyl-carrier-protein] synthase-3